MRSCTLIDENWSVGDEDDDDATKAKKSGWVVSENKKF